MLRYDFRLGIGGNALARAAGCRESMAAPARARVPEITSSCGANSRCYGVILALEFGECLDQCCLGFGIAPFCTMPRVAIADHANCLCPAFITRGCEAGGTLAYQGAPMHSRTQLPTVCECVLRPSATSF